MRTTAISSALALLAGLGLSACGESSATQASAGGLKTGPGVSATTITLGAMTDQSGPFKEITGAVLAGHQIWLDETNAAGGVCGRQVVLETRDHGYKAETAKVQFPEIEPKVAGFLQLLGSPVLAALGGDVRDRKVIAMAGSWSSLLLDNPYLLVPGATYDIEMINALAHLLEKKVIAPGDTIGHIYIDGEFGGDAYLGASTSSHSTT